MGSLVYDSKLVNDAMHLGRWFHSSRFGPFVAIPLDVGARVFIPPLGACPNSEDLQGIF